MSTQTRPPIDFSTFPTSDGKPMAETEANLDQMVDLIVTLQQILAPLGHHAGGNLLVYYNPRSGWDHCSPDVFVALDAGPARRESWKTWEEGKFPEVVFEIVSPSTQNTDIGAKVGLYERLGAHEYYIFDPAGRLDPAYRGFAARGGRLTPLPNPLGNSITSRLLGLEFRVVDGWLRVIDQTTALPFPTPHEEYGLRRAAEQARQEAEQARRAAEQRAVREAQARQAAEQARREAEQRAVEEAQARQTAEAQAAELRRLLEDARAEAARLRAQGG